MQNSGKKLFFKIRPASMKTDLYVFSILVTILCTNKFLWEYLKNRLRHEIMLPAIFAKGTLRSVQNWIKQFFRIYLLTQLQSIAEDKMTEVGPLFN